MRSFGSFEGGYSHDKYESGIDSNETRIDPEKVIQSFSNIKDAYAEYDFTKDSTRWSEGTHPSGGLKFYMQEKDGIKIQYYPDTGSKSLSESPSLIALTLSDGSKYSISFHANGSLTVEQNFGPGNSKTLLTNVDGNIFVEISKMDLIVELRNIASGSLMLESPLIFDGLEEETETPRRATGLIMENPEDVVVNQNSAEAEEEKQNPEYEEQMELMFSILPTRNMKLTTEHYVIEYDSTFKLLYPSRNVIR